MQSMSTRVLPGAGICCDARGWRRRLRWRQLDGFRLNAGIGNDFEGGRPEAACPGVRRPFIGNPTASRSAGDRQASSRSARAISGLVYLIPDRRSVRLARAGADAVRAMDLQDPRRYRSVAAGWVRVAMVVIAAWLRAPGRGAGDDPAHRQPLGRRPHARIGVPPVGVLARVRRIDPLPLWPHRRLGDAGRVLGAGQRPRARSSSERRPANPNSLPAPRVCSPSASQGGR